MLKDLSTVTQKVELGLEHTSLFPGHSLIFPSSMLLNPGQFSPLIHILRCTSADISMRPVLLQVCNSDDFCLGLSFQTSFW